MRWVISLRNSSGYLHVKNDTQSCSHPMLHELTDNCYAQVQARRRRSSHKWCTSWRHFLPEQHRLAPMHQPLVPLSRQLHSDILSKSRWRFQVANCAYTTLSAWETCRDSCHRKRFLGDVSWSLRRARRVSAMTDGRSCEKKRKAFVKVLLWIHKTAGEWISYKCWWCCSAKSTATVHKCKV